MRGARPIVIRNPPGDRALQAAVEAVLDAGVTDPIEAEHRLRQVYPRVVVRPRDLESETMQVWYVYREGRWTAGE